MTLPMIHHYICAVCGKTSLQMALASTNAFGAHDLDSRPPEMARSSMRFWIQRCPHCGYISESLDNPTSIDENWLADENYKNANGIEFKSDIAEKFYQYYLINLADRKTKAAFCAALHAAWGSDDTGDTENAVTCRKAALDQLDILLSTDKGNHEGACRDTIEDYNLMRMDLLRRTGQFSKVIDEYADTVFSSELLNKIKMFQITCSQQADSGCHTEAEAVKADVPAVLVGPEEYYEKYLRDKTIEQIEAIIYRLRIEIENLKAVMEDIDYPHRGSSDSEEAVRLQYIRQYIARAKQAIEDAGGEYKLTKEEQIAAEFDENISFIQSIRLSSLARFFFESHEIVLDGDMLQREDDNKYKCWKSRFPFAPLHAPQITKDELLSAIRELHMGEWKREYEHVHYTCLDGIEWTVTITYNNGLEQAEFSGDEAFPYNFGDFLRLFGTADDSEVKINRTVNNDKKVEQHKQYVSVCLRKFFVVGYMKPGEKNIVVNRSDPYDDRF